MMMAYGSDCPPNHYDNIVNPDGIHWRLGKYSRQIPRFEVSKISTEILQFFQCINRALQFNQHIDKTLLYPVHAARTNSESQTHSDSNEDILDDSLATPTSDVQHLIAPEITTHRSPKQKTKAQDDTTILETNPFRTLARDLDEYQLEQNVGETKLSRSPRNPFEWSTKRSGKVLDDPDYCSEFSVHDEKHPAIREAPIPQFHSVSRQSPSAHIGQWTGLMAAGVGGGSSKLQAIQKWFKSDSCDGRETPKRRSEFADLTSVSVRDLVKAIGCSSTDVRGNGNMPGNQCSSPISISSSKSIRIFFSIFDLFIS